MTAVEKVQQEIQEIQRDLIQSAQNSKFYESNFMFAKRNVEKCKITLNEIESLKEDERVFKPIGKMFILKGKKQMATEIQNQQKLNETNAEEFQKNRIHYENKAKEYEKQLIEIVKQFQKNQA